MKRDAVQRGFQRRAPKYTDRISRSGDTQGGEDEREKERETEDGETMAGSWPG